ncbi:DNA-directed RNA polymerase III subunit C37 [Sporobolomyces salmoneus]|uniref:DNA-directed RNA polymerase III subunit C37 n=1 Tax=Sporobolomyces salmoneus TaxID=183962 RepID=UPI00316F1B09
MAGSDTSPKRPSSKKDRKGKQRAIESDLSSSSSSSSSEDEAVDPSSTSDDDDPIEKELDVYYTPQFLSSLTLLQYPDRPPQPHTAHPLIPAPMRPRDEENSTGPSQGKLAVKYKANSQHLELTLPMEMNQSRWNEEQAKHFAQGVIEERDRQREKEQEKKGRRKKRNEGDEEEERRWREEKEQRRLDKMVYASTEVPEVTSYLVGVIKDNALHLNPVTQTFQLRPSLTYLDNLLAIERRAKREAARNDDVSDEEISDTELKKEEAKAVQVSIKTGEQPKGPLGGGNGRAGAGLFAPLRAEEAEDWKPIKHFHANTDAAHKALNQMFVTKKGVKKLTSTTKPKEYLYS